MSLYRLKRKLWVLTLNQLNCVALFIFRDNKYGDVYWLERQHRTLI